MAEWKFGESSRQHVAGRRLVSGHNSDDTRGTERREKKAWRQSPQIWIYRCLCQPLYATELCRTERLTETGEAKAFQLLFEDLYWRLGSGDRVLILFGDLGIGEISWWGKSAAEFKQVYI
ncbi:hypothetical protein KFK09_014320 [Dendrobium nobile]|uniref:Uncharacterized protein n=1 Tax=Dendrobium nobile TaxID=94219 RepID=A0A8T3BCL9_DENNO|nr:hypothetical protein KFK09_014320 [Dendrobium nobile]